jgi:hypothetical protein
VPRLGPQGQLPLPVVAAAPPPAHPQRLAPMDPAALLKLMKGRFRAGDSLYVIARDLTRVTPAPNGTHWRACDVRAALLHAPREPGTRLRKAA